MIINKIEDLGLNQHQAFLFPPINMGSVSGNEIIKLCKSGYIDKDVAATLKYLYKFKCATLDYIVKDMEIADSNKFSKKIKELCKKRILNAFVMTDSKEEFSEKGLVFYTLDYGALVVLKACEDDDNIENWKASDTIMTGLKVKKSIMLIDLYRKIKPKAEYFKSYPMYLSFGARLRAKAVMSLRDGQAIDGKTGEFIIEIVCKDDLFDLSESRIEEKTMRYEQLLTTDGWKWAGFVEKPTLLVIGDSAKSLDDFKRRINNVNIEKIAYAVL